MRYTISSYLYDFFYFIKKPNGFFYEKLPTTAKIKYLCFSFLLIFAGAFFSALLSQILKVSGIMPNFRNLAVPSLLKSYNIFIVYTIIVVIAPIIEELAFRALLIFSKFNLVISSGFLFYILIASFVGNGYLFNTATYYKIAGSIVTALLVNEVLSKENIYNNIKTIWENFFPVVFYTSAAIFAYLHLFNFGTVKLEKVLFSPIIVLPFFIYAIALGFVRIKLGLLWAVLLHVMLNFFVRIIQTV
ncbi:CPBP family intramembrane metalloprotease [Pontibacter diazotrophicus]|uniref:CPBP family intramembrane metalloprotease n=1 Tax=Pontibacter diazotrophicus TaxID=1400979 RepID=A0A3D8L4J5_9BACT|nr:CPBP family glutamic-type intramembrane protease [Pontibacter diazotrophicus]RDV11862.1 CPBP family intramembrane metalloprotease [Pontibacter diazotrophicus]